MARKDAVVKVDKELLDKINKLIEKNKFLYTSCKQVVNLAILEFINVRKINFAFQGADSCEQRSDFSEHKKILPDFLCRKFQNLSGIFMHPKNKGLYKPHFLRCGALCFSDKQNIKRRQNSTNRQKR